MSKGSQGSQPDFSNLNAKEVRDFVKGQFASGSVAIMPEGKSRAGFYNGNDFKNRTLSPTKGDDTIILFGGNLDHLAVPGSGGGGQAAAAGPYSDPEKKEGTFAFPITTVYSKLDGKCDLGLQWDNGDELAAKMLMEAELKMLQLAIAEGAKVVVPTDNRGTPSNPGKFSAEIFKSGDYGISGAGVEAKNLIKEDLIDKNYVFSGTNPTEAVGKLREIVKLRRDRLRQLINDGDVAKTKEELKRFCEFVQQAASLDNLTNSLSSDGQGQGNGGQGNGGQGSNSEGLVEGAAINYQITNDKIQIHSINPLKHGQDLNDYLNAFDVEFEPIIEYYKNWGDVEFEAGYLGNIGDGEVKDYLDSQLKRAKNQDSRYKKSEEFDQKYKANLLSLLKQLLGRLSNQRSEANFFEQISSPNPNMLGPDHRGEFIRYHRKNPKLEALSPNGDYWYVGGNMSKVMDAYAKNSGFEFQKNLSAKVNETVFDENGGSYKRQSEKADASTKYQKGEAVIFVRQEVLKTDDVDISKELAEIKEDQRNAKIYIPLNYGNGHWTLLEIDCAKGKNGQFGFTKNYFNPSGMARVPGDFDEKIDDQITRAGFGSIKLFKNNIRKDSVAHQNTKHQTDWSSCGPISCWYFNQRINGRSCQASENFPSGALDLRKQQLQLVSNHAANGDEVYSFARAGFLVNIQPQNNSKSSQNTHKKTSQKNDPGFDKAMNVLGSLEEFKKLEEGKSWLFSALYSAYFRASAEAEKSGKWDGLKFGINSEFEKYPDNKKSLEEALNLVWEDKTQDLRTLIKDFETNQKNEAQKQKESWEKERKANAKSTYLNAIFSDSSRSEESKIIFRDHFIEEIARLDSFKKEKPRDVIESMMDVVFPEEDKQVHIKKVSHNAGDGSAKLQEDLKSQVDLQELVVDFGKRGGGSEVLAPTSLTPNDTSVQLDLTAFFIVDGDKKSAYIKQQDSTWIRYGSNGIQDLEVDFKIDDEMRKKITFAKYSKQENFKVSPYKKSDAAKFTGKHSLFDPEYAFVSSFNPDLMRGGNDLSNNALGEAELTHPALSASNSLAWSDAQGANNLSTLLVQFSSSGLNEANNDLAREGFLIGAQTILNNSVDRYLSALEGYQKEDEKVKELREFLVNSDNVERSSKLISEFESTNPKTIEALSNLKVALDQTNQSQNASSGKNGTGNGNGATPPVVGTFSEATITIKLRENKAVSIKTAENNLVTVFEDSGEKKILVDKKEFNKTAMAYYLDKEGGVKTVADLDADKVAENKKNLAKKNLAEALTIERLAARSSNPPSKAFTPISAAQIGATVETRTK